MLGIRRIALPFAVAAVLGSTAADAQPRPRTAADPAGQQVRLAPDAVKRLKSRDPAQIKSALDDVRMSARAGAPAVPAIVEVLRDGLTPALTVAALETLGDVQSEAATETVVWYARDRNVEVRRAAMGSLAKTGGPIAAKALRAALSDGDPGVRGLAATSLGSLKAKESVGDLFVALDHKVPEAAASIGMLCAGNECDRLASKLGSVPFDVVTSGLDQVLFRPQDDVSDDLKVKLIGHVRQLGTAEAHRFLQDVQTRWPKTGSQRVKQSIDQAVLATGGSPASSGDHPEGAGQ
jgi:HEAT repeat protein